ncbi:COX assembly mitochondrial protein homolog [Anthonomus grandis grandis]|uniref:COX assembly mitochondrial protein homolog n=1 Tax=Anthonomus grandis grandis TaxID=2921223 RepID=UPI0021664156|nr:COX assembly mitochondrial protein homolog [Anthonomus grandis grandis]
MPQVEERTVLPQKFGGGPKGLGDPDDLSLRKVELDVMIPKKMRELAREQKCFKEVEDFTNCCQANNLLMVVKCRKENSELKNCLTKWYNDEGFKEHCKNLYLQERSQYRRTGIPTKTRLGGTTRIPSTM